MSATAGKLQRVAQLAAHGLNTPELRLIPVGTVFDDELRAELRREARGRERMTVRTYHPADETTFAKGPFAPEIPVDEAIDRAEEFSRDWHVLFQESIDVDDTVLAGNVALAADGSGTYEVLAGPYRVRDVETPPAGAELLSGRFTSPAEIADSHVRDVVERVLDSRLLEDVTHDRDERVIIEFNVQRHPVGRLDDRLLLWEWRPLGARRRRRARASAALPLPGLYGIGVPGLPRAAQPASLGGKGSSLVRAVEAGLPVPPAFAIVLPLDLPDQLPAALESLRSAARALGEERRFSVSVRSSPAVSMPGMLDTVLDVEPEPAAVEGAVGRVLESWSSERAIAYRTNLGIHDDTSLAVVVQTMVYADLDERSGAGVGFTRDPRTGAPRPAIEYVHGRRGEELVGGRRTPGTGDEIERRLPDAWRRISGWLPTLERAFRDAQEFEFAVERGRPYLLQSRSAKRTAVARVRIAHDLFRGGVISQDEAAAMIVDVDLTRLAPRTLRSEGSVPVASGRVASPGVAVGRVVFDRAAVESFSSRGDDVVLVAEATLPEDYPLFRQLAGLVTRLGGVTSHAAVAALEAGIPALVGCEPMWLDPVGREVRFGSTTLTEGDAISLDATGVGGSVYEGSFETRPAEGPGLAPEIVAWASDAVRPTSAARAAAARSLSVAR